jgi:hypothetical protein
MRRYLIAVLALAAALVLALAGCGSSSTSHPATSNPYGQTPTTLPAIMPSPSPTPTLSRAQREAQRDYAQASAEAALDARQAARRHYRHVTVASRRTRVVFSVTGSGYPSIQYGTDSNTVSPPGGYGPLGDGNALPWSATMRPDNNALYWAVSAQLEGGGNITATVSEVTTTTYLDGHQRSRATVLATAHAAGGYNIANAEYSLGF